MPNPSKAKGRPKGSEKDDLAILSAIADMRLDEPRVSVRGALRRCDPRADDATIRRIQDKFKKREIELIAKAQARRQSALIVAEHFEPSRFSRRVDPALAFVSPQMSKLLAKFETPQLSKLMENFEHPALSKLLKNFEHPALPNLQNLAVGARMPKLEIPSLSKLFAESENPTLSKLENAALSRFVEEYSELTSRTTVAGKSRSRIPID